MWKISVIGETNDLEKNKAALKFSEFDVQFLTKEEFETASTDDSMAIVILPWQGFQAIFNTTNFKYYLEKKSVIVAGPAIYFFEIEEWVIDGSVSFLSSPVNSMQVESVLNEILRTSGDFQGELATAGEAS